MSAVVQRKVFDPATTAVPNINLVLDSNITAGSLVAVFFACSYGGDRGTFTVVDGGANSFTEATTAYVNGGFANIYDGHVFYYLNHPGSQNTLTVDTNQNDFQNFKAWVIEFSGIDTSGFVAAEGQLQEATGTGTDAISSLSLTTANNNDLLLAWTWDYDHASPGTGTLSAGTDFTSTGSDAVGNLHRGEYRTVASPGSVAGTFTHSVAGNHITMAAAFKEAATTKYLRNKLQTLGVGA